MKRFLAFILTTLALVAVLAALVIAADAFLCRGKLAPRDVTTLRDWLDWQPDARDFAVLAGPPDHPNHLLAYGPHAGFLPSGPSA